MPPAPQVSLVGAAESDLELLALYMQQLRCDDPMPRHNFADDAAIREALKSLIINPEIGRIWIIRLGETAVGYAALSFVHILEFAGRCALLDEFFVQRSHRGQGIAKAALQWIDETARQQLDIRALFLEVSPGNTAARNLYRTSGFEERPYNFLVRYLAEETDDT